MDLTNQITILEAVWTFIAFVGAPMATLLAYDAQRDIRTLKLTGANGARSALARTHMASAISKSVALTIFLLVGLYAMSVPSREPRTTSGDLIGALFVFAEFALVASVTYNQRVRRRVLDSAAKEASQALEIAAALVSREMHANTTAILLNTAATEAATHALHPNNHTTDANTEALQENTHATQVNTEARAND